MIPTPLQPQYKLHFNVRPVKHAYFVREDDMESLLRVLRLVCTQWGGMYNLIIPVKADISIAPVFQDLLTLHEPDSFVSYLVDPKTPTDENDRLSQFLCELWPHRQITPQIGQFYEEHDLTCHAVSVIPDEVLKTNILKVHALAGTPEDQWIHLALFGSIYHGQEKYYADNITLSPSDNSLDSDDFWQCQFQNSAFSSVLNLTTYGVSPYEVTAGWESNHFDVVLVNSVTSLCAFWDFRSTRETAQFLKDLGRRTLLLPERRWDKHSIESLMTFMRAHLIYPDISSELHVFFCCWESADINKVRHILQNLEGVQEFTGDRITLHHTWSSQGIHTVDDDLDVKRLTYRFGRPFFPGSYREGVDRQVALSVEMHDGPNEVFFAPPPKFRNRTGGVTALDIVSDVWQRYPKEHSLADSVKSGAWFSRYGISMICTTADRPTYITLDLPDEWDTIHRFFAARGYEARLSRPATYAKAVVDLIGGLKQAEVLTSKAAYLVLDALAIKSTKKLVQEILGKLGPVQEGIGGLQTMLENLQMLPELKPVPKSYRQLADVSIVSYRKGLLGLLGKLSERQLVRRGFYLTCKYCETASWYPLGTILETVTCPGCSYRFHLPVEYPEGSGLEVQWAYTLNSLVNRVMDQDVLPVILALYHLTEGKHVCCIAPGLELIQSGNVKAEFDFVYIMNQQMYAGECKAGTELSDKDIEEARLAATLGVHHFNYCTVARFSEETQKRVEALKAKLSAEGDMELEVLNGDDLLGDAI